MQSEGFPFFWERRRCIHINWDDLDEDTGVRALDAMQLLGETKKIDRSFSIASQITLPIVQLPVSLCLPHLAGSGHHVLDSHLPTISIPIALSVS